MSLSTNQRKTFLSILLGAVLLLSLAIIYLTGTRIENASNINPTSYTISYPVSYPPSYTKIIEGKVVKAIIPKDWKMEEFDNKESMELDVSSPNLEYSGLTRLQILDEDNRIIFNMGGVTGVGGNGICGGVIIFSDTTEGYVEYRKDILDEYMSISTPKIDYEFKTFDLSNKTYSNFNFLGLIVRRVENKLYWRTGISEWSNQEAFNAACGLEAGFIKFEEVYFEIKDLRNNSISRESLYDLKITEDLSEEDLIRLDNVLKSIQPI